MKAFTYEQYGSPKQLQIKDIPKPVPQAGEILVKVEAVSLNPADWRLLRANPFFVRLSTGILKPKNGILGADVAGRVEAVGENVTQFKPGDEVFGDIGTGGFAEYAGAGQEKFALKPPNITFDQAAAVPLAGITALQAARDAARIQPGEAVLVNGASGGVGTFAVQLAKVYGAEVTAVCSGRNVDLVCSLGADHVIDYAREDFTRSGRLYDVILDIVGNHSAADHSRVLTPTGRGVLIGFSTLGHMLKTMMQGAWISRRSGQKIGPLSAKMKQVDLAFLAGLLEAGDVRPVIDRQVPFEELPKALAYLETGRARGKVVVQI